MPILHRCEQYSDEYDRLKLGLPTSSHFKKLITPKTGKPSEQWKKYAHHLISERLLNRKVDFYRSDAMERGLIVESEAADWYEWETGRTTEKIGFITDDARTMGCSPDRLVGEDGLLEIKCPLPDAQIGYLLSGEVDREHWPQLQGQLYISQRRWVDILAWHPELPRALIRVERDEEYIDLLAQQLNAVIRYIDGVIEGIREVRERQQPMPAPEISTLSARMRTRLEIVP